MNILLPGEKNRSVSHVILEKLEWYNWHLCVVIDTPCNWQKS